MDGKKKIIVYSTTWCGDCMRSKYFLDSNKIPYTDINIEQDEKAMQYVLSVNNGSASTPTIVVEDEHGEKTILTEPSNEALGKAVGIVK